MLLRFLSHLLFAVDGCVQCNVCLLCVRVFICLYMCVSVCVSVNRVCFLTRSRVRSLSSSLFLTDKFRTSHTQNFEMYKKAAIFLALAALGADAFAPMSAPMALKSRVSTARQTLVMGTFVEEFKFRKIANRFTFKVRFFL